MAVTYLTYTLTSTHGKFVQSVMTSLRESRRLSSYLATFSTMIDGDPTNVANFTTLKTALGCADNVTAKGIYDELNSLNAKLTTDGSVTLVNAAIEQALAKLLI